MSGAPALLTLIHEDAETKSESSRIRELELAASNDPNLAALAERCTCGHDRGDHFDAAPHACEPCSLKGRTCKCFIARRVLVAGASDAELEQLVNEGR